MSFVANGYEILHPIVRTHVISRAKSRRLWTSRDRAQHKYPERVRQKTETAFFEGAGFVHVYGVASLFCPYPSSLKWFRNSLTQTSHTR